MTAQLLTRGMLAGLLAGLLAFAFAWQFGEPAIEASIALEAQHAAGHHDGGAEAPELVSRAVQSSLGLLSGIVVYGTAIGGLFALVFAIAQGRLGRLQGRELAIVLAAAALVAVILVPTLKYPANPPAVGNPETIGQRTALYFTMLAISIAAMVAAFILASQQARRHGAWTGVLRGAALYLAVVVSAGLALPSVNEVPNDFPAALLYDFRRATLGVQVILWAALGLGFGALALRREVDSRTVARHG